MKVHDLCSLLLIEEGEPELINSNVSTPFLELSRCSAGECDQVTPLATLEPTVFQKYKNSRSSGFLSIVKEKICMILVKIERQSLLMTIVKEGEITAMGSRSGREIWLKSEYNKGKQTSIGKNGG